MHGVVWSDRVAGITALPAGMRAERDLKLVDIDRNCQLLLWAGGGASVDIGIGVCRDKALWLAAFVITVVYITQYAPLVVYLSCVWVAPDGLLHEVEHGGRLLLDDVYGAAGGAGVGASGAALEGQYPSTLTKGSDMVESPGLESILSDGADDCDTVAVELDVDHVVFNVEWFCDLSREQKPCMNGGGNSTSLFEY